VVAVVTGVDSVFTQEALFFSQVAVVTFGGAYAVLLYVGREVVTRFALSPATVVAGLALAETTPGPLILVLEFLGYQAAYQDPGSLTPAVAGLIGAAITLWATFVPCFVWIFAGAPYVERLRSNRRLSGGLTAITAAVVGVIATLAVTLAAGVLFDEVRTVRPFLVAIPIPDVGSIDLLAVSLAAGAFVAMHRLRWNVLWIVGVASVVGLVAEAVR
jgi:chromate transporter